MTLVFIASVVSLSSCRDDDPIEVTPPQKESNDNPDGKGDDNDSPEEKPGTDTNKSVTDKDAGTFKFVNITTNEQITASYHQCFVGDTIKVEFSPKAEYAQVPFEITAEPFTKLNDSLFVVTDLETDRISKNVNFKAQYAKNDSTLTATELKGFFTYVEKAHVTYTLNVSDALLQFVDVIMEFTDERGHVGTVTLGNDDWKREAVTFYEYENEKGARTWSTDTDLGEEWKRVDERVAYYTFYNLEMDYEKLDMQYSVRAKYIVKQGVQPVEESYELEHNLQWGPATVAGAETINVSIKITDYTVKRENVASYLENLAAKPDELTLFLDKRRRRVIEK